MTSPGNVINRRREGLLPLAWAAILLCATVASPCSPANAQSSCHSRKGAAVNPWKLPKVTFPASKNSLPSPDHRYVLKNVDSVNERPPHTIWLVENDTGRRAKTYQYSRWVNVFWSPYSNAFVINDFYASDDSKVMLFVLGKKPTITNVSKNLEQFLSGRRESRLLRGYPTFVYATRWINRDTIEIRLQGFAGTTSTGEYREPFEQCFFYRIAEHSFTQHRWPAAEQNNR